MKEDKLALSKAVESGDTDLGMYHIFLPALLRARPSLTLLYSISCPAASAKEAGTGLLLPSD